MKPLTRPALALLTACAVVSPDDDPTTTPSPCPEDTGTAPTVPTGTPAPTTETGTTEPPEPVTGFWRGECVVSFKGYEELPPMLWLALVETDGQVEGMGRLLVRQEPPDASFALTFEPVGQALLGGSVQLDLGVVDEFPVDVVMLATMTPDGEGMDTLVELEDPDGGKRTDYARCALER